MRGTVVVGTAGVGFVAVSPCLNNNEGTMWITGPTFGGTSTHMDDTIAGLTVSANPQQPYTNVQLDTAAAVGRIVGAELSAVYTGTQLNMGGSLLLYSSPDHSTIANATAASYTASNRLTRVSNRGQKVSLPIAAVADSETRYTQPSDTSSRNRSYPFNSLAASSPATMGQPIAYIMFVGEAGNTFDYEYIQHSEFVGPSTAAHWTKSHSDPVGFNLASNAVQTAHNSGLTGKDSLFNYAMKEVQHSAGMLSKMAIGTAESFASRAIMAAIV